MPQWKRCLALIIQAGKKCHSISNLPIIIEIKKEMLQINCHFTRFRLNSMSMPWLYIRYSFQLLSLAVCTFPLHSGTTATKIFSLFKRLFMSILFSFNSNWRYAFFDEKHAYKYRKQGVCCVLTLWELSSFLSFYCFVYTLPTCL